MKPIMGKDVAEEMFKEICEDLGLDMTLLEDDEDEGRASIKKIISALQYELLTYSNEVFMLKLRKPIQKGDGEIAELEIKEPTAIQLRGMSSVKKKNDDVGKAMAVLGEVTELGLPIINKLKSRDLMVAVGVMSLFL